MPHVSRLRFPLPVLASALAFAFAAAAGAAAAGGAPADAAAADAAPAGASPGWEAGCVRVDTGSTCVQPFSEGLAAVRVGTLGGEAGRWGYVDRDGRMAIEPRYTAVLPFRHGLAAAEADGAWGYIDTSGAWVAEPTLRRATPFNEHGTALVEDAQGRLRLMDREGRIVRTLPAGAMLAGAGFGVGGLAGLAMPSAPLVWESGSHRSLRLPAGVEDVHAIEADWLLVGPARGAAQPAWGYARPDGTWEVAPEHLASDRAPLRDGDVVALHGPEGWRFVDTAGAALGDETAYPEVRLPLPGTWLVQRADASWEARDADRSRVASLGKSLQLHGHGDWRVAVTEGGAWLLGRAGEAHRLDEQRPRVDIRGDYLWLFAEDAGQDAAPRQIVDMRDGRRLLDEAARKAWEGRRVQALNSMGGHETDPDMPAILAILVAMPDDEGGAAPPALLNAEGRVLPIEGVERLRTSGDARVVQARTADGRMGLIDGRGGWRVPAEYARIDSFVDGMALARLPDAHGKGQAVVLTPAGERLDVPLDVAEGAERLAGERIVYVDREAAETRRSIWDVRSGQALFEPRAVAIEAFRDGYALAREDDGWGVIDPQGRWRIAPGRMGTARPVHLGGALFLAEVPAEAGASSGGSTASQGGERGATGYRLYSALAGNALQETLSREPEPAGQGYWLLTLAEGGVVLVDAQRRVLLREQRTPRRMRVLGDRLVLDFDDRHGAIDERGDWRIAPELPGPLAFVAPLGYASVTGYGRPILVDTSGARRLPEHPGAQPIPGMARLAWSRVRAGDTQLLAPDGTVLATLPQPHALDPDSAGDGRVAYREGERQGFMDESGKRLTGPHFDRLGPWREGRAYAQRRSTSGSLLGYLDAGGGYAIEPRFGWAQSFAQARAWVIENGTLSLIDADGAVLLRSVVWCGQRVLVDAVGEPRWPQTQSACRAEDAKKEAAQPSGRR